MTKIKVNKTDLTSLIEHTMDSGSPLNSEGKLEFLISRINDLKNTLDADVNGIYDNKYISGRLASLINSVNESVVKNIGASVINEAKKEKNSKFDKVMHEFGKGELKTPNGDTVTDHKQAVAIAYSESGLDEEKNELRESIESIVETMLNEYKPNGGFDAWADIETNGDHRKGITNRTNFTRKQNASQEEKAPMTQLKDFTMYCAQISREQLDSEAESLFRDAIRVLNPKQLNALAQFRPVEGSRLSLALLKYVEGKI